MKSFRCKLKFTLFFSIMIFAICAESLFAVEERKTVKVAYFHGEGFLEVSSIDGHRYGYGYEYLQTLSYYTGWKYEYIDTFWGDAIRMIQSGEADILVEVSKTPERMETMLFADHAMGSEDYYLYVLPNTNKIRSDDVSTINGKKVGVNADSYQLFTFREWCVENGVKCDIIEFENDHLRDENFLSGKIDAVVDYDFYFDKGWVPLYKTGKSNYYIVVTPSRKDLYDELNEGQAKLFEASPLYIEKLQTIYFPHDIVSKILTTQETEWIEQRQKTHGSIKLGYTNNYLPYCAQNEETGELEGAITVFLGNLKDLFGVEIEPIPFDDREALYDAVRKNKVDACFPVYNKIWQSEELGIMQTDAIIDFPVAYIFRKNEYDAYNYEKTLAISKTSQMHIPYIRDNQPSSKMVFYDDYESCINAVSKGEVDGMYINSFIFSRYSDMYQDYKNLDTLYMQDNTSLSIGVSFSSPELLSIFNKSIPFLDDAVKTSFLVRNSQIDQNYTFKHFFRDHSVAIIIFVLAFSSLIISFFWGQLARVRAAQKQAEVAKKKVEEVNTRLVDALKREKESQSAVHEAFEAANKASNIKTEFLSSISDIRTPMNAIVGMTEVASENINDSEKVQHCLSEITMSSKQLLGLINEVIDMNTIEAGKLSLVESEFNFVKLVDDFISLSKSLVKEKEHVLIVNVHDIIHEKVIGDAERIQQCLMNFMSNAIKYTPNGGTIKISVTEKATNRPKIGFFEFVFEDNGIGMSEDFVKVVFEPFARANDERVENQQGTGLGLSITQNIIKMMNGDIKIESELNKGTKVTATMYLGL